MDSLDLRREVEANLPAPATKIEHYVRVGQKCPGAVDGSCVLGIMASDLLIVLLGSLVPELVLHFATSQQAGAYLRACGRWGLYRFESQPLEAVEDQIESEFEVRLIRTSLLLLALFGKPRLHD